MPLRLSLRVLRASAVMLSPIAAGAQTPQDLTLVNATVIDGTGTPPAAGMTIVVRG
jgi:hypothetical protein